MWVSNLNSYGGVEEENDLLKVCLKEHQGRQGDSVMNSVLSADRKQVSTVSGKIFMPLFCWSPQISPHMLSSKFKLLGNFFVAIPHVTSPEPT